MTASASVIRASARRMALPTATRARSGSSGKGPRPPREPRGAGQLGGQPVAFGPGLAGPAGVTARLQLADLGVEALEAVPVLGDRLMVEDRMRRAGPGAAAAGPAEPGQPGDQIGRLDVLTRVGDQHGQVDQADAVLDKHTAVPPDQAPLPA